MNWYKLSQKIKSLVSFTLPTKGASFRTVQFVKWIYTSRNLSNKEALKIIEQAKTDQNSDDVLTFEIETDWSHPEALEPYARKIFENPQISVEIMPSVTMEDFEKEL